MFSGILPVWLPTDVGFPTHPRITNMRSTRAFLCGDKNTRHFVLVKRTIPCFHVHYLFDDPLTLEPLGIWYPISRALPALPWHTRNHKLTHAQCAYTLPALPRHTRNHYGLGGFFLGVTFIRHVTASIRNVDEVRVLSWKLRTVYVSFLRHNLVYIALLISRA